jgi:L-lactate utilization protein LutB
MNPLKGSENASDALHHLLQRYPGQLAAVARRYLREQFLSAQVAVSGANFAIAETGRSV